MAANSDVQQNRQAQLKQAFAEHLPQRIASVQRRTIAMWEGGWDINTLHLIYSEIQQLAGSSGGYGLVRASDKLFALEVYLSAFTVSGLVPDADQTVEIQSLISTLDEISGGSEQSKSSNRRVLSSTTLPTELLEPIIELSGLPATANVGNKVAPPLESLPFDEMPESPIGADDEGLDFTEFCSDAEFTDPDLDRLMAADIDLSVGNIAEKLVPSEEQFKVTVADEIGQSWRNELDLELNMEPELEADFDDSVTELTMIEEKPPADQATVETDSDSIIIELETTVSQAAEQLPGQRKTVYFLRASNAQMDALASGLEAEFDVHSFDDVEEFREILGALGPDAVMIEGEFFDQMETLAPLVKRIRAKSNRPMPMIAFADSFDIATRLKVLRAGAEAFMNSAVSVAEVSQRLRELLLADTQEPNRILIVEDDRSQAMFARSILRKAGMEVKLERNPMKVLDTLEEFRPDLILMDLYMPDCDGIELTAIIREREPFTNTPIVFLSGESDTDKQFDALLAGGDDFLAKPIRPRHLIQAVTNRVHRARHLSRQRLAPNRQVRDPVTGLVQRPILLSNINALLSNMDNIDLDLPGGIVYVELDQPYELRQEFGLKGLEQLAEELAPVLSQELVKDESTARYGDSAYCILIPGRSKASLNALAQDLITLVRNHDFVLGDRTAKATISTGVCMLSPQLADAGAAVAVAQHACREQQTETDAATIVTTAEKSQKAPTQTDQELARLIANAIENRHFQMLFQPIVSLHGSDTEQYQTLIRLPGDDGRPIAAARFLPVAEKFGHLVNVDRWITFQALSVIDERSRKSRPIFLFVNQSGPTVEVTNNLSWYAKLIETRGVDPGSLAMEFKLPEIVHRLKAAVAYCAELEKIGIQVAIGGFDGSNAAFQVLEHLQAHYVKLPNIGGANGDEMFGMDLKKTIDRLHGLNKLVIIPAIEDAKTAAKLWPTGVDFIQGNFVQAPESGLAYQF